MPVQPVLNHVPLKQVLGLKTKMQKAQVAGLSAPPPVAAHAIAGLATEKPTAEAAVSDRRAAHPCFGPAGAEGAGLRCAQCQLPLGDLGYAMDGEGKIMLHGECKAQLILQDMQKADEARLKKEAALKRERRAKYDLGWKVQRVPRNQLHASKLGCASLPQGLCALAWSAESRTVSVVPTANAAASINLEYLSLALRARKQDGREPMFSLDPKVSEVRDKRNLWQVKRFEPAWLDGTSVGEVMFQADYHLKELSMGEHCQPVSGMRNALDYSEEQGLEKGWCAREWFIVNKAEIQVTKDSVMVPRVEMGVEARETFKTETGLQDVPITRPDHPLVQYADAFTHNFELIAERKSVVFHLRELAKASVLAKFLVENQVSLGEEWFSIADMSAGPSAHREIPQLWNEQRMSQIQVEDGRIVSSAEGVKSASRMHGVYGGVEMGVGQLQRVTQVPVGRVPTAKVSMARAPNLSQRLIQARTGLAEMPLEVPGAAPGVPKGVDLNLDRFDLDAAVEAKSEEPEGSWGGAEFIGRAFWKNLSGSAFAEEDRAMLRALFDPHMCDRREDCELFVPPVTDRAHVQKLRKLLEEEAAVREQRKAEFLSTDFAPESSSSLFPGWRQSSAAAPRGPVHARPEYVEQAAGLVKGAAASFDKVMEDATRFRIYQLGSLEVRTLQEAGSQEVVGAVFSSQGAPASTEGEWSTIAKTDRIVKAVLYVEADPEATPMQHFFTVLETDQGDFIMVEMLRDGSQSWVENAAELETRRAHAKVLRATECSKSTVAVEQLQDFRATQCARSKAVQRLQADLTELDGSSHSRQYAEAVLLQAAPAKAKAWATLNQADKSLAKLLGVTSAEGWDTREAAVFGLAWGSLSKEQNLAAMSMGFDEACWSILCASKENRAPPATQASELSLAERVAQLTEAEREAMMEEWVKRNYGISA